MAFDFFSGGNSTQESETRYPAWVENTGKRLGERAHDIATQPYEQYGGRRVAKLTGNEKRAYNKAGNLFGKAGDMVRSGFGVAKDVAGTEWDTAAAERYMNPYRDVVFDRINEQAAKDAIGARAGTVMGGGVGAFGDARTAVLEGELERGRLDATAMAEADAYESARRGFGEDLDRKLRAGDLMGVQGGRFGAVTTQDLMNLERTGATKRSQAQARHDVDYGNFVEKRDWLNRGLNAYTQAMGMGYSTGKSAETPTPSPFQQAAGVGLVAGSLYNEFF